MRYIQTLKSLSNLAIPFNEKVDKGLGDLIQFNSTENISILTKKFIHENHNFLEKICKYLNKKEISYKKFVENIYKKEDQKDTKYFFEEFRVFAVKIYFSHPYVIKKLGLFDKFVYGNIEIFEDNQILNSLKNKNDINE